MTSLPKHGGAAACAHRCCQACTATGCVMSEVRPELCSACIRFENIFEFHFIPQRPEDSVREVDRKHKESERG